MITPADGTPTATPPDVQSQFCRPKLGCSTPSSVNHSPVCSRSGLVRRGFSPFDTDDLTGTFSG
ncbi:hypothetical protein UPYG_G00052280 [Umbra pygmaea]|uniref:Uncharacterized protein n=1 Tax=Umbra pygmaea TaxID=75934 RepID=A0ABD0XUU1_UMBPY